MKAFPVNMIDKKFSGYQQSENTVDGHLPFKIMAMTPTKNILCLQCFQLES